MALTERLAEMVVFASVVNARGFAAAARELKQSTAAVSKAVARLEAHLGLRLLNRSTRKLTLTEAGAAFFEHCQTIIAEVLEAEQHLGRLQATPRGNLRLAVPTSFGLTQVAQLLPQLLQRHPEMQVDLEIYNVAPDMIRDGLDLLLAFGEPLDSTLVGRRLATVRNLIVASPEYLQKNAAIKTPEDLLQHACLQVKSDIAGWEFSLGNKTQTVSVRGPLRATNMIALQHAVLAGVGIARLPSYCVAADLSAGRLKCLLQKWVPNPEPLYAYYPTRQHMPTKVKAALDFFIEHFGAYAKWESALNDSQCFC